ncbi:MCE family protein [Mycobacterium deserti]|uniref:MCE family protein n=1 Tax=Mycobacterium deserti TaxID=2978347 RepID=A0ABT2MFZ9_9MYCO|nr:MlaD family protein [Mycobacterium deserti]MCT7661197.1 MCE family protein [Mycobacterium deserti]
MTATRVTFAKFGIFAVIMTLLTGILLMVFSEHRGGASNGYTAVFGDASGLKVGDSVRAAGLRVGTVKAVELKPDKTVVVGFDADRTVPLTAGTRAAVRYLNLVGDRYLELVDHPGSTRLIPTGSQIPIDHTSPALDLDVLLGGLKPVIQSLNPADVNALTASLIQIMQGQGGTVESLFSRTSSFTNALADNHMIVEELIDNLNSAMATLEQDGERFTANIDRLHRLVGELSDQRDPIGTAIDGLAGGTASLADLLTEARSPLAGTIAQLGRLAPNLEAGREQLDAALGKAPDNYRKLARIGSYGSFLNYYLCGIQVRVTDLQGRTAVFPWIKQETGRCAEEP